MNERRRDVTLRRSEDSEMRTEVPDVGDLPVADPSGSAQEPIASIARSSNEVVVDLEETDAEGKDDDTPNDHVPKLVTRDMIVALWRQTTTEVRTGFILKMDEIGLPGEAILAYCLGLEVPEDLVVSFPLSAFYKMGMRALGRGAIPLRRLAYQEQVYVELRALKDKISGVEQENADPDADGAKPLQFSEEDWNKMTPAEQAAKLGSSVRQLARQGLLDPCSWHCNACRRINMPSNMECQRCRTSQQDAFGGYILPSQDREMFENLTTYYGAIDADAKRRKNNNKLAKRAEQAKARAYNDENA